MICNMQNIFSLCEITERYQQKRFSSIAITGLVIRRLDPLGIAWHTKCLFTFGVILSMFSAKTERIYTA